jgi:hypothetical protein
VPSAEFGTRSRIEATCKPVQEVSRSLHNTTASAGAESVELVHHHECLRLFAMQGGLLKSGWIAN